MVYRLFALTVVAGLISSIALAQTGNAMLDGTRTSAPAAAQAPGITPVPLTVEQRGDILMARKMYREAIDTFREGSPKDPVLLNKEGIAYHQLTQLDSAKKAYEQAIKLKPDYVEALNNLGTVYYATHSYRRAISWYEKALKIAPDQPRSASIYMNLGTAWFARKKYQQATASYRTALKLDPEVFEHHSSFGVMLEEHTVQERAKYHYYVARLYAQSGNSELALQYLRKALEEGFKDKAKMAKDPEFATIRDLPEFKQLMALEPRVL
jgi:tetratricopeptide (TPR) repeat protein